MRASVSKSAIVAVHLIESKADVRLVDGDLVPVGGTWRVDVITTSQQTLKYVFGSETDAVEAYARLSEPGHNHEFECDDLEL